jgi:hypothetical protein
MADPVLFPRNAAAPAYFQSTVGGVPPPPPSFMAARSGRDLIVQKAAPLPDVCVKCGRRDGITRKNVRFSWTPPWIFATALISILITAILSAILTKRGNLDLPLCPECRGRWGKATAAAVLSGLWVVFGFIFMIVAFANEVPALGILFALSLLGVPLGVGLGYVRPRRLYARKIDDPTITLVGVHSDSLDAIVHAAAPQAALPPAATAPAGSIGASQ